MDRLLWRDSLNTGIDVIDGQHRRIVDYINQLRDAVVRGERAPVGEVIESTIDYTLSHFGFEEALMEDAGYEFVRPHKKVHELFIKRVGELHQRFKAGEDVAEELHSLLARWLFSHIGNDDAGYVNAVKANMQVLVDEEREGGWLVRAVGRFFGRKSSEA